MKKRLFYFLMTVILFLTEVFIAIYVHDNFIRPYIGDVLVVIVIYMFLRIIIPDKIKLLPLYVFIFAVFVEIMQYINIVQILGLESNKILSIAIGSSFDLKDILCYAVGCGIMGVYEYVLWKKDNYI